MLWGPAAVVELWTVADLADKLSKPVGCSEVTILHADVVLDMKTELSKLAPSLLSPLELTAHFEPPKRYVTCRCASIDNSGDTDAQTSTRDILLPFDDERVALLSKYKLKSLVLPRCYTIQHDDNPDQDHLYNARPNWTSKQLALYQAIGEIAEELASNAPSNRNARVGLELHELAGRGPLEVLAGCLTITSEFALGFCQQHLDGHTSHWQHWQGKCGGFGRSWPHCGRKTCHCDLGCLIATAGETKLDELHQDLKEAGRFVLIRHSLRDDPSEGLSEDGL